MCGFSAKGPWAIEINTLPYGAYTELQARKIADGHKRANPTDIVRVYPLKKLGEMPVGEYADSILAGRVTG